MPDARRGLTTDVTIESDSRGRNRHAAGVLALDVAGLVTGTRAGQERRETFRHAPLGVVSRIRIDESDVGPVRIRLGNVVHATVGTEHLRRVDDPALVADRATRNVENRTGLQQHRAGGRQPNLAAVQVALLGGSLDRSDVAGEIADRRALPCRAVGPCAAPADIDEHRLAAQRPIALHGAVFELAAAQLDLDHVVRDRPVDAGTGDVDPGVGRHRDAAVARIGGEGRDVDRRSTRRRLHHARRRGNETMRLQRNRAPLELDQGT